MGCRDRVILRQRSVVCGQPENTDQGEVRDDDDGGSVLGELRLPDLVDGIHGALSNLLQALTPGDLQLVGSLQPLPVRRRPAFGHLALGQAGPLTQLDLVKIVNGVDGQ